MPSLTLEPTMLDTLDEHCPVNTETMHPTRKKMLLLEICVGQEWLCFWCGELMNSDPKSPLYRTLDHVVPLAARSPACNKLTNLKAACFECNQIRNTGNFKYLARRNGQYKAELLTLQNRVMQQRKELAKHNRCGWCRFKVWIVRKLR